MVAEGQLYALIYMVSYRGLQAPVDLGICGEILEPISVDTVEQLSFGKSKVICRKEQFTQCSTLRGAKMEWVLFFLVPLKVMISIPELAHVTDIRHPGNTL